MRKEFLVWIDWLILLVLLWLTGYDIQVLLLEIFLYRSKFSYQIKVFLSHAKNTNKTNTMFGYKSTLACLPYCHHNLIISPPYNHHQPHPNPTPSLLFRCSKSLYTTCGRQGMQYSIDLKIKQEFLRLCLIPNCIALDMFTRVIFLSRVYCSGKYWDVL